MNRNDMLYYFLLSAKGSAKRIKVSGGANGVRKGYVRALKKEGSVLTADIEGENYVIDLDKCEVKTGFFDSRVLHVSGEEPLKFQLW